MEEFPSGQRGQTVNLLSLTSVVRIHPPPPRRCGWYIVRSVFFIKKHRSFTPPLISSKQHTPQDYGLAWGAVLKMAEYIILVIYMIKNLNFSRCQLQSWRRQLKRKETQKIQNCFWHKPCVNRTYNGCNGGGFCRYMGTAHNVVEHWLGIFRHRTFTNAGTAADWSGGVFGRNHSPYTWIQEITGYIQPHAWRFRRGWGFVFTLCRNLRIIIYFLS